MEKLNQPDEEGWITVTPKNRKANLALTQRNIEKLKLKQKKKRQQMVNFKTHISNHFYLMLIFYFTLYLYSNW